MQNWACLDLCSYNPLWYVFVILKRWIWCANTDATLSCTQSLTCSRDASSCAWPRKSASVMLQAAGSHRKRNPLACPRHMRQTCCCRWPRTHLGPRSHDRCTSSPALHEADSRGRCCDPGGGRAWPCGTSMRSIIMNASTHKRVQHFCESISQAQCNVPFLYYCCSNQ